LTVFQMVLKAKANYVLKLEASKYYITIAKVKTFVYKKITAN